MENNGDTLKSNLSSQGESEEEKKKFKRKAGIFLASVTGISAIIGFGTTVASVKKRDPEYFNKGMIGSREMAETGASLAMRALGWGTIYAITGCSILAFTIWKLVGAKDMKEFRMKVGSALPSIPKNKTPQGRTEFTGLNDLLEYVSSQGSKKPSE